MSRFVFSDVARDGNGVVCQSATATVYLAGTSTLADVYAASSGGAHISSVTTSATDGSYAFFVDQADYDGTQNFKVTVSLTGFTAFTLDNIVIQGLPFATITATTANITTANITTDNATTANITTGTITTANLTTINKTGTGLVTNLNADLLDSLNSATASTVSTIVARDSSGNITGKQLISDIATGTAPLVIASTTEVANLHVATATNLAMTGEASATSATSPVTLDLGTVTTGDRIFVTVSASLSLATNANYAYVIAEKSSGTATITLQNGYSRLSNLASGSSASGIAIEGLPTVSGIMQVTAGGTLVIKGTCAGSPTSLSSVSIYAFFLKKQ
jgi:hypothetical protein